MLIMGIPVLAVMGAMGISLWILLILCLIPLSFGILLQLILTAVTERRGLNLIPAGIGAIGLILSLIFLKAALPIYLLIFYWAIYFLLLWATWLIVRKIRNYFTYRQKRSE